MSSNETIQELNDLQPQEVSAEIAPINTLIATGLRKRYGSRWVVKDVSLQVKSGEVVGLLGV